MDNNADRAIRYRKALGGDGRDVEVALALACSDVPPVPGWDAEDAWEGALLAEVSAGKLRRVVDAGDWPMVAALADLAGEDPWSGVVRCSRARWGAWNPPGSSDKPGT